MVINDKLKGEFYRTPITKLASRNNILTTLNELVDYFNNIYELLDSNFENISRQRESMKEKLLMIYEKTMHFKYVLDHFRLDVDTHILERLNDAIENFQNRMTTFVTPYELNLFNHSSITDDKITTTLNPNSVEDWDRSVNMLASNLGIRWFGGKLSNKSIVSEVNNLLQITKVNTYEGHKNEDYINSNLILEIFLYTKSGITWLSLGKNGDFGYNIITKYRSPNSAIKMKIASEEYNTRQTFDTNVFDFNMIIDTIAGNEPSGDMYVKIKTNIPSNTESGKEGYFLNFSNDKEDFVHNNEIKKGISEFARGIMYHDNKDVAYFEHENDNIFDIKEKTNLAVETPMVVNVDSKDIKDFQTNTNEKVFYSSISSTSEDTFVQSVYNPEEAKMVDLMDIVSGYIIANSSTKSTSGYFDDIKMNEKYEEGEKINYTKGENLVDISDESFIGDLNLIAKNENMFGIENIFSRTKVVPSQIKYGTEISNQIIENTFTNNENFINMSNNSHTQEADIVLTPISNKNSLVYKVLKVSNKDILIIKSDGIFRFNSDKNVSNNNTYTERLPTDNLFDVCYDALTKDSLVFLATNKGIFTINVNNFSIQNAMNRENAQTGVIGGEWSTLFETTDKKYIIALRKDFSTSVVNGRISYGESVAVYANNTFNVIRVTFGNDILQYTYDNPALDNELTETTRALDYSIKRQFQSEFKVLPIAMENKYYFFRYGHKMLVTDAANDEILNFKNFKIVEAMRSYDIADAVIFDNKLYFTVYEGGNYYYDFKTNTVSEVQYTYTKVINNRNTLYKSYYMSKLSNLVGDNADSTGTVDKYIKLTPEELEAGYVPGTKYYYPSIRNIHIVTLEERLLGPDPDKDYYGCIGNKMSVTGSWFIGKLEAFDNITNTGVENPDMNYGYIEYADDGKYLDYTLAASIDGFNMDPDKIYKKITVEEVLPKINCFLKVENGKLFFIPNNENNEIRNVVYINGYYYFATNQNYIFKLDDNFHVINTIKSEDCNEVLGDEDLLVIQNNKVTSEEVTKNELYYDKVDGSEMINGYNSDLTYYKENIVEVPVTNYVEINKFNNEFIQRMRDGETFYVKENDEYREATENDYDIEIIYGTEMQPTGNYIQTQDTEYVNGKNYYFKYVKGTSNGEPIYDYRLCDAEGFSDGQLQDIDGNIGFVNSYENYYEEEMQEVQVETSRTVNFKNDVDYYERTESTTEETEMIPCEINEDNFILTPKYTAIDAEEREQGIQPGTDYYVSRDLPDSEVYDHVSSDAKSRGYDSTTFNMSEYYLGDLSVFDPSLPDEENIGKELYASNEAGTNYDYVGTYRGSDITALNPEIEYYYPSGTYTPVEESDFNIGLEFLIVDKELIPVPENGVGYYIRLDQPDPNTGIPYTDAGIGGETLLQWDPNTTYYIPWKMYYHFKNDNTFGYQKTYFHKRLIDNGVEYIPAELSDYNRIDEFIQVTPEEIVSGPIVGIDYFVHPSHQEIRYSKVYDKSNGADPNETYYKLTSGNFVYTQLTEDEISEGPKDYERYFEYLGGIYVEVQYPLSNFNSNKTYYRINYNDSNYNFEITTDFDSRYKLINKQSYSGTLNDETIQNIYLKPSENNEDRYEYILTDDETPVEGKEYYKLDESVPTTGHYVKVPFEDLVTSPEVKTYYIKHEDTYERVEDNASIIGLNKICTWYDLFKDKQSTAELLESITNAREQKSRELGMVEENDDVEVPKFTFKWFSEGNNRTCELVVYTTSGVKQISDDDITAIYNNTDETTGLFKQGYIYTDTDTGETFDTSEIYFCLTNSFNTLNDEEYYTYEYDNYKQLNNCELLLGPQANKSYFIQNQNNELIKINNRNDVIGNCNIITPDEYAKLNSYGLNSSLYLYEHQKYCRTMILEHYREVTDNDIPLYSYYIHINNEDYVIPLELFNINPDENGYIYYETDDYNYKFYEHGEDGNGNELLIISDKNNNELGRLDLSNGPAGIGLLYEKGFKSSINYYTPKNPSYIQCNTNDYTISDSNRTFKQNIEYFEKVEKRYELVQNVIKQDDNYVFLNNTNSFEFYYITFDYKNFYNYDNNSNNLRGGMWYFDKSFYELSKVGMSIYKEYGKTYVKTQDTDINPTKNYYSLYMQKDISRYDTLPFGYFLGPTNEFTEISKDCFIRSDKLDLPSTFELSDIENIELYLPKNGNYKKNFVHIDTYSTEPTPRMSDYPDHYYWIAHPDGPDIHVEFEDFRVSLVETSNGGKKIMIEFWQTNHRTFSGYSFSEQEIDNGSFYVITEAYVKLNNPNFNFKYLLTNYELQEEPEYVQTTRDDYNYTGNFENVQFKDSKNYYELLSYDPFKPNMDYFLKHEITVFDKYVYELNSNYKQKLMFEKTDSAGSQTKEKMNIVKCKDIYTNTDAIYGFNNGIVYKFNFDTHNFDQLFTIPQEDLNENSFLLSTNGKLFVIGIKNMLGQDVGYAVYDWIQDNTATWKSVASSNNLTNDSNYSIKEVNLYENNTCILIRRNESTSTDELFYYDYINRAFTQFTDLNEENYTIRNILIQTKYATEVRIENLQSGTYDWKKSENNSILIEVTKQNNVDVGTYKQEVWMANLKCVRSITGSGALKLENAYLYNGVDTGGRVESGLEKAFVRLFTDNSNTKSINFYSSFLNYDGIGRQDDILYIVYDDKIYTIGVNEGNILKIIDEENKETNFNHYGINSYDNKRSGIYAVKFEYGSTINEITNENPVKYLFVHVPNNGDYEESSDITNGSKQKLYVTKLSSPTSTFDSSSITKEEISLYDQVNNKMSNSANINFINLLGINIDDYDPSLNNKIYNQCKLFFNIKAVYYNLNESENNFSCIPVLIDSNKLINEGVIDFIVDNNIYSNNKSITLYKNYFIWNGYGEAFDDPDSIIISLNTFNEYYKDGTTLLNYSVFNEKDIVLNKYNDRSIGIKLIYEQKELFYTFDINDNGLYESSNGIAGTATNFTKKIELPENITSVKEFITVGNEIESDIMYIGYGTVDNNETVKCIMDKKEFEPGFDYFTRKTHYEFLPYINYYLKSIVVNFRLDMVYFTQKVKTIVQNVIQLARSYTSTDTTSKLYHKSLLKEKLNSVKTIINSLNK